MPESKRIVDEMHALADTLKDEKKPAKKKARKKPRPSRNAELRRSYVEMLVLRGYRCSERIIKKTRKECGRGVHSDVVADTIKELVAAGRVKKKVDPRPPDDMTVKEKEKREKAAAKAREGAEPEAVVEEAAAEPAVEPEAVEEKMVAAPEEAEEETAAEPEEVAAEAPPHLALVDESTPVPSPAEQAKRALVPGDSFREAIAGWVGLDTLEHRLDQLERRVESLYAAPHGMEHVSEEGV